MELDPHAAHVRDIALALNHDPRLLEYRFQRARDKELKLRMRLAMLERHTARAWELLSLSSVGRVPWPPLDAPLRPPTLHEAMRIVLEDLGNPFMSTSDLAYQIARRGLYVRRNGLPASASDIAARACTYPQLFARSGSTVRLRRAGLPHVSERSEAEWRAARTSARRPPSSVRRSARPSDGRGTRC